MAKVKSIDPAAARAGNVKSAMEKAVADISSQLGSNLAGFVLVGWDMRGEASVEVEAQTGPIGKSMVPSYVKDVLMWRIAADGTATEGDEN